MHPYFENVNIEQTIQYVDLQLLTYEPEPECSCIQSGRSTSFRRDRKCGRILFHSRAHRLITFARYCNFVREKQAVLKIRVQIAHAKC